MTTTDLITRKLSHQLIISEDIIHKVISYQWKSAKKAMDTCLSIELTNLGTFHVRPKKVKSTIDKLNRHILFHLKELETLTDDKKIINVNSKIEKIRFEINLLEEKLKQYEKTQL